MPSIQKRPNGSWRIRFQDSTGSWRSRHFDTEAKAKTQLAIEVADVERGQWVDWRAGRVLFGTYAEAWLKHQIQHRASTSSTTKSRLDKHILPVFKNRPMASVSRSEVRSFVTEISKTLAPSTVEAVYRLLAQVFLSAVDDRIIALTPCRKIALPERPPPVQVVPYTVEQVAIVAAAMPARRAVMVWFGANAGLRVSEGLAVTVDRLEFLKRTLRVDRQLVGISDGRPLFGPPKTKASAATIPLAQSTLDRIAAHLAEHGAGVDELVIATNAGRTLDRHRFHEEWAAAAKAVGLGEGARFHELRHVYASVLIRKGLSPKAVQARMRHATIAETFDTYGHLWPDDEERTREAIDEAFAVPQESRTSGTAAPSGAQSRTQESG